MIWLCFVCALHRPGNWGGGVMGTVGGGKPEGDPALCSLFIN